MDSCLFCRIVSGELPATVVYEDDDSVAFLDHRPLFHGHTLLVPREHVETLGELPAKIIGPYFEAAQLLSRVVESAMDAEGTFVAMNNRVSQSVPHLHVHVVPRWTGDTNFMPIIGGARVLSDGLRALYDKLMEAQERMASQR